MTLSELLAVLVPLAFIIYWIVGLLKDATNRNLNGVVTRVIAFVGAFIVIVLYAHSSIDLGGSARAAFDSLGTADQILLALAVAAGGGTLSDGFRTFNRHDTNVAPTLVPPKTDGGA